MKGMNVITMNRATVMEAIQEYLERQMVKPDFDVIDFQKTDEYGEPFDVTIKEREPVEL